MRWRIGLWVGRVVEAALHAGITQFLDLGSGVPSVGAVHDLVGGRTVNGRVVYVDNDPIAYAHTHEALGDARPQYDSLVPLFEDLRQAEAIFADPEVGDTFDLTQPVCVLMAAVLPFIGDETNVPDLLGQYRSHVTPASWLAISHIATDAVTDPEQAEPVAAVVNSYQQTPNPMLLRDRAEIASWLTAWGELLNPGIVHLPQWSPQPSGLRARGGTYSPVLLARSE